MTKILDWVAARRIDVGTTIRTVAGLSGVTVVDIDTVSTEEAQAIPFLKGYKRALEDVALVVPERPIDIATRQPLTTSVRSARSKKTQRVYWSAVRQIMKTEGVSTHQARHLYAKRQAQKRKAA